MTLQLRITVADTPAALAEAASLMIVEAAREAVAARGRFTMALAGGATPRETYQRLARPPLRESMPWDRTWMFFGDERAVAPDHRESNYGMAHEALLASVPLPPRQVFRMRAETEDPDAAAAEYAEAMLEVFGATGDGPPRFDLVLLGLGVDGHTASLFPNSPALQETARWVIAVHAAAAAIPRRLTMTLPVLNAARRVAFLSAGAEKAKAVRSVLRGPSGPGNGGALPAALIRPHAGSLDWFLDRAAAALLDPAREP
jgi:6-phosphogluconolactonase